MTLHVGHNTLILVNIFYNINIIINLTNDVPYAHTRTNPNENWNPYRLLNTLMSWVIKPWNIRWGTCHVFALYPVQWFMNVLPVLQRLAYSYISNLHVTYWQNMAVIEIQRVGCELWKLLELSNHMFLTSRRLLGFPVNIILVTVSWRY